MSTTAGRVFAGLTRASFSRGILIHNSTVRPNSARSLVLSSQRPAPSKRPTSHEEENQEPIKFSTSKASHRTWKVERSMGSHYQQPWWKVLPISLLATGFLLWCVLRGETEVDTQLEKQLYDHLPGLLPDKEKQGEDKSS